MAIFRRGCEAAEATLKAAIRTIQDFGVHHEEPSPPAPVGRGGSVTQNFHGPVSINNLAIAADHAVQSIGNMGDQTSLSLQKIATLLPESQDLTPRQVLAALSGIEALGAETKKPSEKRDWKSILTNANLLMETIKKATDLAKQLAPYAPAILSLIETAGRHS